MHGIAMVTQKDVAKHARVSFITVSRVINNKENVRPETRKRVLAAIKKLNYYPNSFAQGLIANKVKTIAIVPYLASGVIVEETSYYRRLLIGIERYCLEVGYDILLSTQRNDAGDFDVLKPYYERKAAGLILLGIDTDHIDFKKIQQDNIPCAIIGEHSDAAMHPSSYYLDSDNAWGTRQLTEYLIKNGHRDIAYLHVNRRTQDTTDRLNSFRTVMAENNLAFREEYLFEGDFTPESGKQAARAIAAMKKRPTAVVAATDLMALGLLDGVTSLGLDVPDDISIAGYDGHEITGYTRPPLATVVQDLETIGYRSAELVIEHIGGETPGERRLIFPVVFEPRGSIKRLS